MNNMRCSNGLTDKEVALSYEKYGTNTISTTQKNSFIKLVLESLGDPIIKILLIVLAVKTFFCFKILTGLRHSV